MSPLLLDAMDTAAIDYAAGLNADALVGKTVGLLSGDILAAPGHELLFQRATVGLLAAGARVRPARVVNTPEWGAGAAVTVFLASGMRHDMMPGLAARGARRRHPGCPAGHHEGRPRPAHALRRRGARGAGAGGRQDQPGRPPGHGARSHALGGRHAGRRVRGQRRRRADELCQPALAPTTRRRAIRPSPCRWACCPTASRRASR